MLMVKLCSIIITIIFLSIDVGFAYRPTLESLLRFGPNTDIADSSVVGDFILKDKSKEDSLKASGELGTLDEYAFKLHLFNEKKENPVLVRLYYQGGVISKGSLINFSQSYMKSFARAIGHSENFEAEVFYGVMTFLLNNDSTLLLKSLRKIKPSLKSNEQLVDKEKIALLAAYKRYLERVKDLDEEQEQPENPLMPKSEEAKERVSQIMSRPFFIKDPEIKRVKRGKEFLWVVDGENLYMEFNKNHYLKDLKIRTALGEMHFIFGQYGTWGSKMKFPEFVLFKNTDQKWYELKPKRVNNFNDNLDLFRRRIKRYEGYVEDNKITDTQNRPNFLL